jgi:peptide/nickel transport system permease protein
MLSIGRLLLRRAAHLALLTVLVTALTFALAALIPGDFFSEIEANPNVRPEVVARLRVQYGLSDPLPLQYLHWLGRTLRLDLGYSLKYTRPVADVLVDAVSSTLWLGIPALILGLTGGVALGSLHAVYSGRLFGRILDTLSAVALSLPALLLGICAMLLAASTGWFPVGGTSSAQLVDPDWGTRILDRLHHLVLPVLCLTLPVVASVERIQFAAARASAHELYFNSARARGLSRVRVFLNYVVRPALNPVLSLVGPLLGALVGGSLVLEHMFAWPGLGLATYDALFNRDVFLLLGCVSVGSILLVGGNTVADVLLYLADPRTRAGWRDSS